MPDCVDAPVDPMQPPGADTPLDRIVAQPDRQQLRAADRAYLPCG
jgi:hypothetical protein